MEQQYFEERDRADDIASIVVGHTTDGQHVVIGFSNSPALAHLPIVEASRMATQLKAVCRKLARKAQRDQREKV